MNNSSLVINHGKPPVARDDPDRDFRLGLIIAAAFFGLFLGWAALTPMDAAAHADGQLVVSGQRRTVQHRDGGIVSAIHVREGQQVRAGAILFELDGGEVRAQEHTLAAQLINLRAQRARLEAELAGARTIDWPAEVEAAPRRDEVARAIQLQSGEFMARRAMLESQVGVLGQQTAQTRESAAGYESQMVAASEQKRLISQELDALREVAEKGFVSKTRIRALERARADLEGRHGQYRASVAEARASGGAMRLRQVEALKSYRERAAGELREVSFSIAELEPRYEAARSQLRKLQIQAPVSGTVVGLNVFTVGGVIAAGQRLLDIVPLKADLVVEARVSVEDADDLNVGQEAELRFVGLDDRTLPILSGRLARLSADALVDEKSGSSFYSAEFKVPATQLNLIRRARGDDFELRAGAPVQVLISTRRRTALQYAFEPLFSSFWFAGREQ